MIRRYAGACVLTVLMVAVFTGCANTISGTVSWPGARLQKALLTAADFPAGVQYDRFVDNPSQPDGAGGLPIMRSKPKGCSNGLTDVIAGSAEHGPGSAAKYRVQYDGAGIVMTVSTWPLDLNRLAATASRCEHFQVFFDPVSEGIPITTTKVPSAHKGALVYQQTMRLHGAERSVYASFENIDRTGVFGVAIPTDNPGIAVKASLPQTFLDIVGKQADRAGSA
jgi:hypothetical protein